MIDPRRGERLGWYLGFFGGSVWMILPVGACCLERLWWYGLAALAAAVLNAVLILYLPPWKHPTVRYWKLLLPLISLQLVFASLILMVLAPNNLFEQRVTYQLALLSLIPFITGWRTWNDGVSKPKPVARAAGGLE